MSSNVSYDLIWQISRPYSAYLVKGKGVEFSSDPLNPFSIYSKSNSGFANEQAFGVKHQGKAVKLVAKDGKRVNFPRKAAAVKKFSPKTHHSAKSDELVFAAQAKANKLQRARGAKKN